jgi:hypothetical protein
MKQQPTKQKTLAKNSSSKTLKPPDKNSPDLLDIPGRSSLKIMAADGGSDTEVLPFSAAENDNSDEAAAETEEEQQPATRKVGRRVTAVPG